MSSPSASHMPALKVGGRRLSVGNRHKRSGSTTKDSTKAAEPTTEESAADYPRPTEEGEHAEQGHQETEQSKREKNKRAEFSPEHTIKRDGKWADGSQRKANMHGGAGRISQPAGKAMPS
ncbi:hypothetical protein M408DRAFT_327127 [Serendipita vermifera MAFF 305830]|uniref:Uncharacterized protein n=1 Tax=Serendipita vermifera MAFF 305830 TaxID=933852 RepID=A0A0C2X044_SERVB|nr:hypothetical protein M408DRAFT_327127 [Serendipita vermifera MAFF 305830]